MMLILVLVLIVALSPNTSAAAHRFVCMTNEKALEATDEGADRCGGGPGCIGDDA